MVTNLGSDKVKPSDVNHVVGQNQRRITRSSHHVFLAKHIINDSPPRKASYSNMEGVTMKPSLLYLFCIDSAAKCVKTLKDLPFLSFKMLLGHYQTNHNLDIHGVFACPAVIGISAVLYGRT